MNRCIELMKMDYGTIVISNTSGELSASYPSQLIIPEYELSSSTSLGSSSSTSSSGMTTTTNSTNTSSSMSSNSTTTKQNTIYETTHDANRIRDFINKSRCARCRTRFPLPVILYKGKYICRSATLSGGIEMYGRSGTEIIFGGVKPNVENEPAVEAQEDFDETNEGTAEVDLTKYPLFDRLRKNDIRLLKSWNVDTIIDLMVEMKKVKFGI